MNKKDSVLIFLLLFFAGLLLIALYLTFHKDVFYYIGITIIMLELLFLYYHYAYKRSHLSPVKTSTYQKKTTVPVENKKSQPVNIPTKNKKIKQSISVKKKSISIQEIAKKVSWSPDRVLSFMNDLPLNFPKNLQVHSKIKYSLGIDVINKIEKTPSFKKIKHKKWTIRELADELQMTMYDIRNYAIDHPKIDFGSITNFSVIEYNKGLILYSELKDFKEKKIKNEVQNIKVNTIIEISVSEVKKKKKIKQKNKTNHKTQTIREISLELNMNVQKVIKFAYGVNMGFKNLDENTPLNTPQARGLINKIKKATK